MTLVELLAQIARRDHTRSEATLQADIRQLVLTAPLSLSAEDVVTRGPGDPGRRPPGGSISRAGSCLIEVKRDLSAGSVLPDAIEQLAGYLAARQKGDRAADTSASSPTVPTGGASVLPGEGGGRPAA